MYVENENKTLKAYYDIKESNGIKYAQIGSVVSQYNEFTNIKDLIKITNKGLNNAIESGCKFAYTISIHVNHILFLLSNYIKYPIEIFDKNKEIIDLGALKDDLNIKKDDNLLGSCKPKPNAAITDRHIIILFFDKKKYYPFRFLEYEQYDGYKLVTKVNSNKPNHNNYIISFDFKEGDEEKFQIKIKDGDSIESIKRKYL